MLTGAPSSPTTHLMGGHSHTASPQREDNKGSPLFARRSFPVSGLAASLDLTGHNFMGGETPESLLAHPGRPFSAHSQVAKAPYDTSQTFMAQSLPRQSSPAPRAWSMHAPTTAHTQSWSMQVPVPTATHHWEPASKARHSLGMVPVPSLDQSWQGYPGPGAVDSSSFNWQRSEQRRPGVSYGWGAEAATPSRWDGPGTNRSYSRK